MSKEPLGRRYGQLNREYDKLLKSRRTNWGKIELYRNKLAEIEDIMVNRNLKGIKLEKKGNIEEAVKLYEQNVADESDGTHPYNRLAIMYRKKGKNEDEIRVLKKAIQVFEDISLNRPRGTWSPEFNHRFIEPINEFKKRLKKAKALRDKSSLNFT